MSLRRVVQPRSGRHGSPWFTVEVHLANGLPSFTIVGLPEAEVKEACDRVRAALQTARFGIPGAPDHRQSGTRRPAQGVRPFRSADCARHPCRVWPDPRRPAGQYEFAGELALTGELRPFRGALAMTCRAAHDGRAFILPGDNAAEAALVRSAGVSRRTACSQVCAHLGGGKRLLAQHARAASYRRWRVWPADVKGRTRRPRSLEIAAAGGHNLLLFGRPVPANRCWRRACPASCRQ